MRIFDIVGPLKESTLLFSYILNISKILKIILHTCIVRQLLYEEIFDGMHIVLGPKVNLLCHFCTFLIFLKYLKLS